MSPSVSIQSLPDDVALQIISSLQVSDVCSLGCCSRFWRELCESDAVWGSLCRSRWPQVSIAPGEGTLHSNPQLVSRASYVAKHNEMASKAASVCNFVERCLAFEGLEVGYYLKAIEDLCAMQFGFKDIQMFFFKPDIDVLQNLIGLHYCMSKLFVPAEYLIDALGECSISEREVCVQWWKLGRWFHGFRLRDELHSRIVSLIDLVTVNEEVLGVLQRGAIHEVLRVRICAPKPAASPWFCKAARSDNQ